VRHAPFRLALVASLIALVAGVSPASARLSAGPTGGALARQPGPLLNEAAPFNRPAGRDPGFTIHNLRARSTAVVPVRGPLLNEAAPFDQPPDRP
jgi:hypothetical protein